MITIELTYDQIMTSKIPFYYMFFFDAKIHSNILYNHTFCDTMTIKYWYFRIRGMDFAWMCTNMRNGIEGTNQIFCLSRFIIKININNTKIN